MSYTLLIGNKNYSSWSLRPWMILKAFGIPFEEIRVRFDTDDFKTIVPKYSPSGLVPVLVDGDMTVWDSLAIAEYLAERHDALWPTDPVARANARSMCAEMHAGFRSLRSRMPMAVRTSFPIQPEPDVAKDIARIEALWTAALRRAQAQSAGPYLFGKFSIADAYYAPIVWRYNTYAVALNAICAQYVQTMLAHPAMLVWQADAVAEKEVVAHDEPSSLYGART